MTDPKQLLFQALGAKRLEQLQQQLQQLDPARREQLEQQARALSPDDLRRLLEQKNGNDPALQQLLQNLLRE